MSLLWWVRHYIRAFGTISGLRSILVGFSSGILTWTPSEHFSIADITGSSIDFSGFTRFTFSYLKARIRVHIWRRDSALNACTRSEWDVENNYDRDYVIAQKFGSGSDEGMFYWRPWCNNTKNSIKNWNCSAKETSISVKSFALC